MMRNHLLSLFVLYALALAGCLDSSNRQLLNNTNPNRDAGQDTSSPTPNDAQGDDTPGPSDSDTISDTDSEDEDINRAPDPLVGNPDIEAQLRRPVKVVTDDFGMHHIFAASLEDLFFINGYTYASDRFAQMEFYRRIATGTLAELWGDASPDATRTDIMMRTLGLKRHAERYLQANYDPESESYQALMAYCAGVNAYLAKYRTGEVTLPGELAEAMPATALPDWQPADIMAISKLLALQLTYSAPTWIEWHALRDAIRNTFPADASDPAIAARHGALADIMRVTPATATSHIDGLPSGTSPAIIFPSTSVAHAPTVDPALITRTLALHDGLRDLPGMAPLDIFGRRDPLAHAGNNWVLDGQLTESGFPTVAADPHLPLGLPTPFYPVHLELTDDIDGRQPLKMIGAAIMGLPGVALGRTDHVAWGASAGNYDTTDIYAEELSTDSDAENPPTVLFEGNQVAIERISESIRVGTAGNIRQTVDWTIEIVPHHGPILPTLENGLPITRPKGQALSVKWTGLIANNELDFWMGLWRAKTPLEAETALDHHGTGLSNFVLGFTSGQIFYSGQSDIPQRQPDALNYDPVENPTGNAPIFILPGTGGAEWSGMLDDRRIPHAYNPQTRFIVTANNDPVGTSVQNHPFDGLYYLGAFFDIGFRAERITSLIEAATQHGQTLSLAEQTAIQNDTFDPAAARIAQQMINAIDHVTLASLEGTDDPEVAALLDRYADHIVALEEYRDLLDMWDYTVPATRAPAGPDIIRSAAASLFNAAMVNLLDAVFADEFEQLGPYSPSGLQFAGATQLLTRSLIFLLETPESAQTFDATTDDSSIFDNLHTPNFTETRLTALVNSVVLAAQRFESPDPLAEALGRPIPSPSSSNYTDWIWGKMHGLALAASFPTTNPDFQRPESSQNLPFFERGGSQFSINPCAHNYNDFDFSCSAGPGLRMLHDMNPTNPQTFNAIPGGYSDDPRSPHFMSEFDIWQRGESRKLEDQADLLDASNSAVIVYHPH